MPRRSHTRSRSHSKSLSRSPSRSRSRSPPHHYSRSTYHHHRPSYRTTQDYPPPTSHHAKRIYRSRSRSADNEIERLNPPANKVLGVFGLSLHTDERDVRRIFEKYGRIEEIRIVYDRRTGRSRGFGFIYYDRVEDAKEAKKETHGMDIDGQKIRVDFSLTEKAHAPTPGIYMGSRYYGGSTGGSGGSRNGFGSYGGGSRSGRRTPSYERYSRSRSRSARRSRSVSYR